MDRRKFLAAMAAGAIVTAEGLWIPGQKLISIPQNVGIEGCDYLKMTLLRNGEIIHAWHESICQQMMGATNQWIAKSNDRVFKFSDRKTFDEIVAKNPCSDGPESIIVHKTPHDTVVDVGNTLTIQYPTTRGIINTQW